MKFLLATLLLFPCLGWQQQYNQNDGKLKIDPYAVLGLGKDATPAQIKKAYRTSSMKYHPDKNPGAQAAEMMLKVTAAFEMIGDPDQKVIFDEFGGSDKFVNKWQYEQAQRAKGLKASKKDFYTASSDVTNLETKTFYKFLTGGGPVMIEFYAPWCVHCQDMVGEYKKLAILLEEKVRLGAVNCERIPAVCNQQGVHSYPSLRLFTPKAEGTGMEHEEYQGEHKAETMYTFVEMTLSTALINLGHNFRQVVLESDDVWLVDFSAGAWCGPCTSLKGSVRNTAHALQDRVKVGILNCDNYATVCSELGIQYFPQIRVFKKGLTGETGRELKADSHFPAMNTLTIFEQLVQVFLPPKVETASIDVGDEHIVDDDEDDVHSEL